MKLCQEHWNELKTAIEQRGLMHLVATSGEKAINQVVTQLNGNDSNQTYDPLMSANFAIWGNALEVYGLAMMREDAPCPLCLIDKHLAECKESNCKFKDSASDWIRFASDAQLTAARERGLVPLPS